MQSISGETIGPGWWWLLDSRGLHVVHLMRHRNSLIVWWSGSEVDEKLEWVLKHQTIVCRVGEPVPELMARAKEALRKAEAGE